MAAQAELCCLEPFPSQLSPAEVLLSGRHLDSVFQRDTEPRTVLFTPQRPRGSAALLLHVHPTAGREESAGSGGRLRLFASPLLMRHHGLERLGSAGTVRAVEPPRLDRVVLGARSRQSLRWASAAGFPGGLLELCRPGRWLVVRQGEPLLLPRHPQQGEKPGQVRHHRDEGSR